MDLKVLFIIELVTGLLGFAIICWQMGFWIAFAVYLLIWSNNTRRTGEYIKLNKSIKM